MTKKHLQTNVVTAILPLTGRVVVIEDKTLTHCNKPING